MEMMRRAGRDLWRKGLCLLTAWMLLLQQAGVGYAICNLQYCSGPCCGSPAPCCLSVGGPAPGLTRWLGSAGRGCVSGSCGRVDATQYAQTADPMQLRRGAVVERATDLSVSGPTFSWTESRSFDHLLSAGAWRSTSRYLQLSDVSGFGTYLILSQDATDSATFTKDATGTYVPASGSLMTLVRDTGRSEYVLTNPTNGRQWVFHDHSSHTSRDGKLKEQTTVAWRAAGKEGAGYSYDQNGYLSQITSPDGQDYNLVFSYTNNLLTKIEVRTGATSSTRIKEVEYTYFTSGVHSASVGSYGNLVQVRTAELRTGGDPATAADWTNRYTQYRYASTQYLTAVFEPEAVQRLIDDRADISSPEDILTKADDDNNSGQATYRIKDYASRRFEYYSQQLKTDNTGYNMYGYDPKCVTAWSAGGENLEQAYGGANASESDTMGYWLLRKEIIGGCASCGVGGGITKQYFYLQLSHAPWDDNEAARIVVEDTIDGQGNGMYRTVYGLNDAGRKLREVQITDPTTSPKFWCQSWKFVNDTTTKRHRVEEYRLPAAHNVTSSTVDEFLNPSDNGNFSNDESTLQASAGRIHVYDYSSDGLQTAEKLKQGRSGTAYYLSATDYYGGTNAGRKYLVTASYEYPEAVTSRTDASRLATSYDYTFWSGTDNVATRTTTWPTVASSENGSNSADTRVEYLDSVGRLRWSRDELGAATYYAYHPEHGALAYTVRDCDPASLPASADNYSTKWVTSSDGSAGSNKPTRGGGLATALEAVSFSELDSRGRTELSAEEDGTDGTVLARHYTVYLADKTLRFPYWDTSTSKPRLPIDVTQYTAGGTVTEHYRVDPDRTAAAGGLPTGLSAGTNQSHYLGWTRYAYDAVTGDRTREWRYHDIPASGDGSKDTNYAETLYGRSAMGQPARHVAPGGTITRTVYDALGRASSSWAGTDDTPSSGDWSPANTGGTNLVKVAEYEYDGGNAGDGNRTQLTQPVDGTAGNDRVTRFKYDWRDRQVAVVDAEEFGAKVTYSRAELDNLGRVKKSERYYDADDDESFPLDGTVDGGDRLLSRSERLYDQRGRVYRTRTYAVDPDDGTAGSALVADTWYDAAGQVIKRTSPGSRQFSKIRHDGLGRTGATYAGLDADETAYADADDVTGDTLFAQTENTYDASGNVIQVTRYARVHTSNDTGALSTSNARAAYTALWYDGADRQTGQAEYGTNGGSAFSRPSSAPARSDTVLVTTTEYNSAGLAYKTTDPAGKEHRGEFDDLGRATRTIQNYEDGTAEANEPDQDVTVDTVYNSDGLVTQLQAQNPTTGTQTTYYVYGTATGGITPAVYRNDLVRAEIYPDSDDTTGLADGNDGTYDRVEYKYNRQGNRIEMKDQLASVHTYELDRLGRLTHDRVTTLAGGVDGAVRRISTSYEIRGLREKVTSYDDATVGSGNVVNEVAFEYNDLGALDKEYQEHEGAKDANTLYVQYQADSTASGGEYTKGLRPTSVRYPNARLVHRTYGSAGSDADYLNRLDAIQADSGGSPGDVLAAYTYLGPGTIVVEDYQQPDVKLDYYTAGTYGGFDRFGRVVDQKWYDYGASAERDRYTYGYDRASNRTYRENATAGGKDEFYTYDGVNRLVSLDRGDLNEARTAVSGTPVREEDWNLDMTGNWSGYVQKTAGSTALSQERTHNKVNEITDISETAGTAWATPAQDRNGNMTSAPKPASLGSSLSLKWDAWNRLVEARDGQTVIGVYEFDGLQRRVKRHVDSQAPDSPNGVDTYLHYYYNSAWQTLETRQTAGENDQPENLQPKYQYVWSPRYVDAAVLRDGNTDADGACDDERLYYLNDANFNVTTLVDTAGDPVERYLYDAYGRVNVYDGAWSNTRNASGYANVVLYTGRERDAETGLYHYRHRSLTVEVGRFGSRDSIGYKGGINLYEHVGDSPLVRVDPFGLKDHPVTVTLPDGTKCTANCKEPDPPKPGKKAEPCKESDLKPSCDTKCQKAIEDAQHHPDVKKLLDQIRGIPGCIVPAMDCKDCGSGPCDAGAWHMGNSIHVCDGQGFAAVSHLKHELTHHLQSCRNQADTSCADRMKKEIEANLASGKSFSEAFADAVWSSCVMKRCSVGDITDALAQQMWNTYPPPKK